MLSAKDAPRREQLECRRAVSLLHDETGHVEQRPSRPKTQATKDPADQRPTRTVTHEVSGRGHGQATILFALILARLVGREATAEL